MNRTIDVREAEWYSLKFIGCTSSAQKRVKGYEKEKQRKSRIVHSAQLQKKAFEKTPTLDHLRLSAEPSYSIRQTSCECGFMVALDTKC